MLQRAVLAAAVVGTFIAGSYYIKQERETARANETTFIMVARYPIPVHVVLGDVFFSLSEVKRKDVPHGAYEVRSPAEVRAIQGRVNIVRIPKGECLRLADLTEDPAVISKAYSDRGGRYAQDSNYAEAIADFTRAIEIDPSAALAYHNRGNLYGRAGDYQKAIADYTQALEKDPSLAEPHSARGAAYLELGRTDKAIEDCTAAIKLKPAYPTPYSVRAAAYKAKGQLRLALADQARFRDLTGQ